MVIHYLLMNLFAMKYIHLLDGINQVSMLIHLKDKKTVTVSIRKVSIPNIDIKVWTRKSELLLGNYLHYLTQPESTRQKPIELTGIEYDQIKDEFSSVPHWH